MKKILTILVITLSLFSCNKENDFVGHKYDLQYYKKGPNSLFMLTEEFHSNSSVTVATAVFNSEIRTNQVSYTYTDGVLKIADGESFDVVKNGNNFFLLQGSDTIFEAKLIK